MRCNICDVDIKPEALCCEFGSACVVCCQCKDEEKEGRNPECGCEAGLEKKSFLADSSEEEDGDS